MEGKSMESGLESIKKSVDTLILIEICKIGASREQARKALGTLDNNAYSKINALINSSKRK